MFEFFKNKGGKQPSGAELAEEGLRQVSIAINNNQIELQRGKLFDDIFAHRDSPAGAPRFTYVIFNPSIQGEVIGRCVLLLSRVKGEIPVYQIDWAILKKFRGKGFGKALVNRALTEFTSGMKGRLENGFFIVDEGNEASKNIAGSLIGNEEILSNKSTGSNVHSYMKKFS